MNGLECLPACPKKEEQERLQSCGWDGAAEERIMSEDLVSPEIAKTRQTPPPSFSIGHGINDWLTINQSINQSINLFSGQSY